MDCRREMPKFLFAFYAMGGWKKRGGWKTSRMTPLPKRGFGPPSYGTFSTPLRCQCSVFPVQKSPTEQTRSSFGGVQKFPGERVLWYVFLPPYVLHPPISRPNVFRHKKKEPKPKLLSPDIFWWGGGLPREGVGAKKFSMSLETQGIKLFWRDFAGISRKRPKSLRKKCLGSILVPYIRILLWTLGWIISSRIFWLFFTQGIGTQIHKQIPHKGCLETCCKKKSPAFLQISGLLSAGRIHHVIWDPDGLVQRPIRGCPPKSIGEGASSLFGGRPGSSENVSCSRATPDLHRCNLGVALEQETFSGLPGQPPKTLLAPSPIDLGAIREFRRCTRPSGSQHVM